MKLLNFKGYDKDFLQTTSEHLQSDSAGSTRRLILQINVSAGTGELSLSLTLKVNSSDLYRTMIVLVKASSDIWTQLQVSLQSEIQNQVICS